MSYKKLLIIGLPVLVLAAVGGFIFAKANNSSKIVLGEKSSTQNACSRVVGEATVTMNENGFNPSGSTVKVCTKVTFKNNGTLAHWPASDIHPTHGIYPEFDPKQGVNAGDSWSFVFDRVGRWRFHDHLYPLVTGVMNVTM